MFFVLLLVTGVYFVIIAKLRSEHTSILRENNMEDCRNSIVKVISLIFEVLNKISLTLLAVLMVYNVTRIEASYFDNRNAEFLIWIALIHLAPTTFFCGLLELVTLKHTIKEEIEK